MPTLTLAFRLALGACLALAGTAKLADRAGSSSAMAGFGVPTSLAGVATVALAGVELAIAGALVPTATATAAAAAAVALLVTLSGVLAVRLARGEAPECRCFGRLSARPATWGALVRNAALAGMALVVLGFGPGASALGWAEDLSAAGQVALAGAVALAVVVAGFSALVMHLLRRHGRILLRLEELERGVPPRSAQARNGHVAGLPVGVPAPRFELPTGDGGAASLDELLDGGLPLLLVFSDTRCGACDALLPRVAEWRREHGDDFAIAVVAAGDPDEVRRKHEAHELGVVLTDSADGDVASLYGVRETPAAVLVDERGRVASHVPVGEGEIANLVDRLAPAEAPTVGDQAPVVELPGLTGDPVSLDFDGEPTIVVFWDPGCPACGHALPQLRAVDASPAPRLFVISRGGAGANENLGIEAPVGLDEDDSATRAFGVTGTPAAVLVDAGGRIASPVAEGASAIRVLAAMSPRDLEGVAS